MLVSFQKKEEDSCRGHKRRKYIVDKFYVKPLVQLKRVNGKSIRSDAGGNVTSNYVIFTCTHKISSKVGLCYCGKDSAMVKRG